MGDEKKVDLDVSPEVYEYLDQRDRKNMEAAYKKGVIGRGIKLLNESVVDQLLAGSIHIHEHGGSEPIPRIYDEFDMAINACKSGVRAIVIKTHYTPSSSRVGLIQRFVDSWARENERESVKIFGGITLNYPVGGLNPAAVRASAGFPNGKFVWVPTLDTYHHVETTGGATTGYLQDEKETGIRLLDKDGKVVPELKQILEIIAENDMVFAIGHYPARDRRTVIDEALKIGVKRILADHPIEYHSKGTIEELKILAAKGVYIGMFALTCLIIPPVEGEDYPAKMTTEFLIYLRP